MDFELLIKKGGSLWENIIAMPGICMKSTATS